MPNLCALLCLRLALCLLLGVAIAREATAERVDPAPLPREVTDWIKKEVKPVNVDVFARRLKHHLADMETRLGAHERRGLRPDDPERKALRSRTAGLKVARAEALQKIAEQRALMQRSGATDKAARLDETRKQVESRFTRLERAMRDFEHAQGRGAVRQRAGDLRALLSELNPRRAEAGVVGSEPPPNYAVTRRMPPSPQIKSPVAPRYMAWQQEPIRYASADGQVLAVLDPPPSAADCGHAAADLDKNVLDAQVTPEIASLAQTLDYSAVKIYEYVLNNIKYQPYWGSLKGAQGTLHSKGGGPTDQASLLIALLREANVPARYVRGTVGIHFERGPRWVGAKTYEAAVAILQLGQNPYATLVEDSSGTAIGMAFAHVWVEACVPYGNYRGTRSDLSGYRWIPLDPSFKEIKYQPGIAHTTAFDYAGYMAQLSNDLPDERYLAQVEAAVKSLEPNFGNNTIQDVPYSGAQVPRKVDILPASLPYFVSSFDAWEAGATAETAQLPAQHRYKVLLSASNESDVPLLSVPLQLDMPDIVLKRLTLGWAGATSGDQSALDAWKNQSPTSPISCSINVVPEIRVDGSVVTLGTSAVDLCSESNRLDIKLTIDDATYPVHPVVVNQGGFSVGAANLHALQIYAFQASDRLLTERAERLLASVLSGTAPNSATDDVLGEFLHVAGLKYVRYVSDAEKKIGRVDGRTGNSGNYIGITSSQMRVDYLFDLPFAVHRTGLLVDFPAVQTSSVDISTGQHVWESFQLFGYAASAYESYIWQETAKMDAISTVRGLKFAAEEGIEVLVLNAANWAAESGKFTSNQNAELNYTPADVANLQSTYINTGHTLTIPRSLIQYGNWKGALYIAERQGDPEEWQLPFMIQKYAGGYTVDDLISLAYDPFVDSSYFHSLIPADYYGGLPDVPVAINSGVGLGYTPYTTVAGDPVNMVTGNMFHVERDISIKGRGLPIVFERFYNSRTPKDGPLGFGWTHSFNHALKFYDDNLDGIVNSADSDGVTSSVIWTDGTGSEKFVSISGGSGAGVPPGAVFTAPKGFYFQAARQPDGTYTIREKNGLTYTFESVAGTVDQAAKLVKISDRYNNAVNLGYAGGNLATVTDPLGRSLTIISDGAGRITEIRDWSDRVFRYEYDTAGNLVTFRNPLAVAGQQPPVTYEYYSDASVDSAGTPSPLNRAMKKYTLPRGNGMTFEYYADGRVFKHFSTLGETTTFAYNSFRRETVQINPRGHTRRFFFDPNGNPVRIVEENGALREYTYDCPQPGNPTACPNPFNRLSERDPLGYTTAYQYDALGNVTRITNPSGSTVEFSHFTPFNQPGKIKDARGNYALMKYDPQGNLLQELRLKSGFGATADPANYVPVSGEIVSWTIHVYNSFGNLLSTKRVRDFSTQDGPTVSFTYDAQGLNRVSTTRTGILGSGTSGSESANFTYNSLGRMTSGIGANWYPIQMSYDKLDRVVQATDKIGNLRNYLYDANGNLLGDQILAGSTVVDNLSFSYDLSDRRVQAVNSGGYATRFVFDATGNVMKITNPDGYSVMFEYDELNRVVRAQNEQGHAVVSTLDLEGKPRSVTDPNGNAVNHMYYGPEREGRLKRTTQPGIPGFASGRAVEYDYDPAGNVTKTAEIPAIPDPPATALSVRDRLSFYDELNRPTRSVGPAHLDRVVGSITYNQTIRPVTTYQYDNLGNLIQVAAGHTDASGTNPAADAVTVQMTYTYDDFGRQLTRTDPLGRIWTFRYDEFGNLVQSTDARGQVLHYTFAYGGRVQCVDKDAPNPGCAPGSTLLAKYDRDALGLITQAYSPAVAYSYTYDAARRLQSVTDSRGPKTLTYSWSDGGRLNRLMDGEGGRTDYIYDQVGRLMGLWAPNLDFVTFQWDAGGRLMQKWFPNGITTQYSWNPDGTLATLGNHSVETSTTAIFVSQQSYTYDGFARRIRNQEHVLDDQPGYIAARDWQHSYDELDRLIQATEPATGQDTVYTYDVYGNMKREIYPGFGGDYYEFVHDAAHQLTAWDLFNAAGSSYGAQYAGSLTYDANGSLITRASGDGRIRTYGYDALRHLTNTAVNDDPADQSYAYDHVGRRVTKTVAGPSAYTAHNLYDGDDILAQYRTGWTSPTSLFTHGPGVDDPLMVQEPAQEPKYFHADGLGSVVIQSNTLQGSTPTVYTIQRYHPWGWITDTTESTPTFGFTGREDDGTGLMYYRARYYYPGFYRFIQRDPIGLASGINPYAYVDNNPANLRDPMGLIPSVVFPGQDQSSYPLLAQVPCIPCLQGAQATMTDAPALGGLTQVPGYQGLPIRREDPGGFEAQLGSAWQIPPFTGGDDKTLGMLEGFEQWLGGLLDGIIFAKPPKNFEPPTNPPSEPPLPQGWTISPNPWVSGGIIVNPPNVTPGIAGTAGENIRISPPGADPKYPSGYWRWYRPTNPDGRGQGWYDPSRDKFGGSQGETHVPLPPEYVIPKP